MTRKYDLIAFDLYDTLLDGYNHKFFSELGARLKKHVKNPEDLKKRLTKNYTNLSEFVEDVAPGLNIDLSFYEDRLNQVLESISLFEQVIPTLQTLRTEGYKTAVISNLSTQFKEPFYRLNLDKIMDFVIFSCDVGYTKKDPRIFQKLINDSKVPKEKIIMIGDNFMMDYKAPRENGIDSILLERDPKLFNLWNKKDIVVTSSLNDIHKYL